MAIKTQNQWAKNHINTSIEEPGINESGIEAKKTRLLNIFFLI